MVVTAALVVAYTALLISGVKPPLPDVVLTTWHSSPLARSVGTKASIPFTTPMTLTSSDHRQSLTWCSQIWPSDPEPMPALLHTRCTAPNASSVASRNASTDSSDVTSVTTPTTSRPSPRSSAVVWSTSAGTTSASTTFMPSSVNFSTNARPMPWPAPVTTATFPSNSFIGSPHVRSERLPAGLGDDLPVDIAADDHGAGGYRRARVVRLHLAVRGAVVLDLHVHRSTRWGRHDTVTASVDRMTSVQLRRYVIKPGEMEAFLDAVRTAFPIREQYGFRIAFALVDEERNEFTWAVTHDGDFAAAEAKYYESPERAALPVNPADHIAVMHLAMVKAERL